MDPSPGSLHWLSAQQGQNLRPLCQTDRASGNLKCQKDIQVSTCCQSGQNGWPGGLASCRWRRKVSSGNLKCHKQLWISTLFSAIETRSHSRRAPAPCCCSLLLLAFCCSLLLFRHPDAEPVQDSPHSIMHRQALKFFGPRQAPMRRRSMCTA